MLIGNGLCLGLLLILRNHYQRQASRFHLFAEIWRPMLMRHGLGQSVDWPPLAAKQRIWFLILWNEIQLPLRGEASLRLNDVIDTLALRPVLMAWLNRRSSRVKIVAAQTLGQLREPRAWEPLTALALAQDSMLAFIALRALLQISAEAALPILLEVLGRRQDISLVRLQGVLRRMPSMRLVAPLGQALEQALAAAHHELAQDLVQLLVVMRYPSAFPYLRQALGSDKPVPLLLTTIQHLGEMRDPHSLPNFETLSRHPDPRVRQQAVMALGHLAGPAQMSALLARLEDTDWWTVYRCIEALHRLPGIRPEKLAELTQHPLTQVQNALNYYLRQTSLQTDVPGADSKRLGNGHPSRG